MKPQIHRKNSSLMRLVSMVLCSFLLAACASIPEPIEYDFEDEIFLQDVQMNVINHKGEKVRWGGVITQVINNESDTWVEILALELNNSTRPTGDRNNSSGRFIAKVDHFLDPEIYKDGYSLTVLGTLDDAIDGKIGDFNYSFPVVQVEAHHLWSNNSYRRYPYIAPGYWHYGHYPHWGFGYGYYGFGVRYNYGYYPYYPMYGYMSRGVEPVIAPTKPGVFKPSRKSNCSPVSNCLPGTRKYYPNYQRSQEGKGEARGRGASASNSQRSSYGGRSSSTSRRHSSTRGAGSSDSSIID